MMRFSVVVPTYRRSGLLDRCLLALNAQTFEDFEVLVADDAACVETQRQIEQFAIHARMPLRYLPVTERHGPAAARNIGWRAAEGEIIAFTDDDCVPTSDWLTAA